MTREPRLREPATSRSSTEHLGQHRGRVNTAQMAWSVDIPPADTSTVPCDIPTTMWATAAIKSARAAGLDTGNGHSLPIDSLEAIRNWLVATLRLSGNYPC